jgi:hypothetical protein
VLRIFLNQVSDTPAGPVYWAGPGLMFGLPALIGLFWGAPLVAEFTSVRSADHQARRAGR